jgi:hypothetical protein
MTSFVSSNYKTMAISTLKNETSKSKNRDFLNSPITDPMSTSVYHKYPFIYPMGPGPKYAIKHEVHSRRGCNPSWQVLKPQPIELFNSLDIVNSNRCMDEGIMGPTCGPVKGVAVQEQPPNLCTDMLPYCAVGCALELEIWNPSSFARKEGFNIGSKMYIVFKTDCLAHVLFGGEVTHAEYKWERAVFTGYSTVTLRWPLESGFGTNFVVELRAGTQDYGTAYTQLGMANYRLLCHKKFRGRNWENSLYSLAIAPASICSVCNA